MQTLYSLLCFIRLSHLQEIILVPTKAPTITCRNRDYIQLEPEAEEEAGAYVEVEGGAFNGILAGILAFRYFVVDHSVKGPPLTPPKEGNSNPRVKVREGLFNGLG